MQKVIILSCYMSSFDQNEEDPPKMFSETEHPKLKAALESGYTVKDIRIIEPNTERYTYNVIFVLEKP